MRGLKTILAATNGSEEGGWAVFRALDGRAVQTPVEIGQQAEGMAEVLSGLEAGAAVILYPASTLSDGAAVAARAD